MAILKTDPIICAKIYVKTLKGLPEEISDQYLSLSSVAATLKARVMAFLNIDISCLQHTFGSHSAQESREES